MFARFYLKEVFLPGQDIPMSIFDGLRLRQIVFHSQTDLPVGLIRFELESIDSFTDFILDKDLGSHRTR